MVYGKFIVLVALILISMNSSYGRPSDDTYTGEAKGRGIASTKSAASTSGGSTVPITYHGGPVIPNPVIYGILYGNWGTGNGRTIMQNFLPSVGSSDWWRITMQYNNTSPIRLGNITTDNYSYGKVLTNKVPSVVQHAIDSGALPFDTSGVYLVLSSSDVTEGSFCSKYCGWHSSTSSNLKYAWIGNPSRCMSACATQSTSSPNGNPQVDAMISVVAHELAEAVSDPKGNAWFDINGAENADKCAWTFGNRSQLASGAYYNMIIGGYPYYIQQNWRLTTQSCGLS